MPTLMTRLRQMYLNNPLLKAANVPYSYTEKELDEIRKCKKDPLYFIRNYCKIINPDKGLMLFEMYPYQEQMISDFHKYNKNIILSGRQMGKTTTMSAYIVWAIIFNKNYKVSLLAQNLSQARDTLNQRVKVMYENLPKFLQQGVIKWNESTITLENGSQVRASATTKSGIRGTTPNLVCLDEFAHVEENKAVPFWTSAKPAISSGRNSKVIIASTPLGFNLFWKMYNDALQGLNEFRPTKVTWEKIPWKDEVWKKAEMEDLGPELFSQEHEAEFLGSTNTLIPAKYLRLMSPDKPIHISNGLMLYSYPLPGNKYLITCDPSEGKGLDNSAFIIFDITEYPFRIAGKFADNTISPILLPGVIQKLALQYNEAIVLIETNNNGKQVADILWRDLEYENTISFGFQSEESVGIKTTPSTKRRGCTAIKDMIENSKLLVNDVDLIFEFSTFVQQKKGYEAEKGKHDDLVICCVLMAWFAGTDDFENWSENSFKEELLKQRAKQVQEDILPFGFIYDGINDYEKDDFYK